MSEVDVTGVNAINYPYLGTWEWHVALYLFLGGLVAGLMIFSAWLRLRKYEGVYRGILMADLLSLPLLAGGLLLLWLDLARRWNAWRFYATFQVTSAMSWGAWILLFCMILLGLRLLTHVPTPAPATTALGRVVKPIWRMIAGLGRFIAKANPLWDILNILLGIGLGIYTGVLLSTIPARPLWDSLMLPVLFLVSGLASGVAAIFLVLPTQQVKRLARFAFGISVIELVAVGSYLASLALGSEATQRALELLMGKYALGFWGGVVLVGLIMPLIIEFVEMRGRHLSTALIRVAPILVLAGGLALRFVLLFAGLESFI